MTETRKHSHDLVPLLYDLSKWFYKKIDVWIEERPVRFPTWNEDWEALVSTVKGEYHIVIRPKSE